ncbi:MAG: leucine-rich repeat domain-containing protein [Chloroflexota bacterium]
MAEKRITELIALQRIEDLAQTGATELDLSQLELTILPVEVWECTQITSLDLHGNNLTILPPEIGQLTRLTKLNLSGNQLASLPKEIGLLINLRELILEQGGIDIPGDSKSLIATLLRRIRSI